MKERSALRKRKGQWLALTFVILMTGTLCACGNKKMQEIINSEDQVQEKNEVTLKEKLQVPEEVEYQFDMGRTVTAEVVIPDCTSAGVYEVETMDFTTNYMDDFCKKIFDGGKYNILWPSYIYTKEEIQERLLKLQSEVLEWDLNDDVYQSRFLWNDFCDLAHRVQFWQEEWEQQYVVSDPGNDLVIYPGPVSDDPEIGEINEITINDYSFPYPNPDYVIAEGTINDRNARISFMKAGDFLCDIKVQIDNDLRDDGYSTCTKEHAQTLQMKGAFVYTEEEAIGLANGYLESVGMTGYQPINIDYLVYDSDLSALTGYRITFGLCKNEVSMLYDAQYRGMITVDIGWEGLLGMYFRTPYMIVSNLTDDTELLTFEKISDVAKSCISEQVNYLNVDMIEFGYMVESYEDGQTLIPVWRYRNYYGTPAFTINAIDGSMINPIQAEQMSTVFDFRPYYD